MVELVDNDIGRQSVLKWINDRQGNREANRLSKENFDNLCTGTEKDNEENSSISKKKSDFGPEMTPALLQQLAVQNGGYETPELNDTLYLHFKGFRCIKNLEPYTGLKSLWLDSNGFTTCQGIPLLPSLKCLFLQNNLMSSIGGTTLAHLTTLVTLDISQNRLTKLDGLDALINLQTLNLGRNMLDDKESIEHLTTLKSLRSLDLSNNNIAEENCITDVFAKLSTVVTMNMLGNPIYSEVPQFRKKMIAHMENLRYMDRPVFEMEKAMVQGWLENGAEGERQARADFLAEKQARERQEREDFKAWQEQHRARARAAAAERLAANGGVYVEDEESKRRREIREAAAKIEGDKERELISGDNAIQKLGASFWATNLNKDEIESNENELLADTNNINSNPNDKISEENDDKKGTASTDIFGNLRTEEDDNIFASQTSPTSLPLPPPTIEEIDQETYDTEILNTRMPPPIPSTDSTGIGRRIQIIETGDDEEDEDAEDTVPPLMEDDDQTSLQVMGEKRLVE